MNENENLPNRGQESEKRNNYQDLDKEQRQLWNMKVATISIVISVLRTIHKELVKGVEDLEKRRQVEIIKTTALLRSARILRRVLET